MTKIEITRDKAHFKKWTNVMTYLLTYLLQGRVMSGPCLRYTCDKHTVKPTVDIGVICETHEMQRCRKLMIILQHGSRNE